MKSTVSLNDFREAFRIAGRQTQFSRDALEALFEYLEQYEDETGDELELDPIAICCEFAEYGSAREAAEEYGWDEDELEWHPCKDPVIVEAAALEWLDDNTMVLKLPAGGVILQVW